MQETDHISLLNRFHPVIREWFTQSYAAPTPAQSLGWPHIFDNENTLILAPTGSGKTLAAFLVCINQILNNLIADADYSKLHTLYISPLKALNYDIERNLDAPLAGIEHVAKAHKLALPPIKKAVRTGDTTQKERQRMLRYPPHILITTPESLHLLLTSKRARDILKNIRKVIVDEIHALSNNKRGTFLSILLERLVDVSGHDFTRIGLSATQKPLEEIASYLAGFNSSSFSLDDKLNHRGTEDTEPGQPTHILNKQNVYYSKRPIAIVDAGMRKRLDLRVISPVSDFRQLPANTIWPDIYEVIFEQIQKHKTTLIFANNRATVERITSEVNERAGFELARAHHGSVSKRHRKEIESMLKSGQLPALVATATLELGIDMGAIDLVCQVESPKSVARGLQRVGRAGHLYKSTSKGFLIPKMRSDLLEIAAISREMKRGNVSPVNIPRNCLDILAQQIVAAVALESHDVDQLFNLFRRAYPFRSLAKEQFLGVVEMLSGRYPSDAFKELKPRISWDRLNNTLHPLPGTQRNAIFGGGAIPDTGQFGCYLEDGITKLGELEEEFVHERRVGDVFVLGTTSWKIIKITHDRVIVSHAPGQPAKVPFWKGEFTYRDVELGRNIGTFTRELKKRLGSTGCTKWLRDQCALDEMAAENLIQYLEDQLNESGAIPDDKTIILETFPDEIGDLRVIILSPFGGRLHLPWRLAIIAQFRKMWNVEPESWHSDVGMMFRFTSDSADEIINIISLVKADNVEDLVVEELANSPFFGLRFRQNANRAILIPRPKPGQRAPLWLQRIRARNLLEITRKYPSFPIVLETYRECMQDYFAMDELIKLFEDIESQNVELIIRKGTTASPFSSSLMFDFTAGYMYEYDAPKIDARGAGSLPLEKDALWQLLKPDNIRSLLSQDAINEVQIRLQSELEGYRARSESEFFEMLRRLGDLTPDEVNSRIVPDPELILSSLQKDNRIMKIELPGTLKSTRWILTENFQLYKAAFPHISISNEIKIKSDLIHPEINYDDPVLHILKSYIQNNAMFNTTQLMQRYPVNENTLLTYLKKLNESGQLLKISSKSSDPDLEYETHWGKPELIERVRRVTLKLQRQTIQPCDSHDFQNFLFNWHHVSHDNQLSHYEDFIDMLEQYQGLALPAEIWETHVFQSRFNGYQSEWLDELCRNGDLIWSGETAGSGDYGNLSFTFRENLNVFLSEIDSSRASNDLEITIEKIQHILDIQGACFLNDIVMETELPISMVKATLWEMIWQGIVTNDSFGVIRAGKPVALTNESLKSRGFRRSARGRKMSVRSAMMRGSDSGRWSLLPGKSDQILDENIVEKLCRQLLRRHGVVCRELYEMDSITIPWAHVYNMLIKLEWRGEIKRGYFVRALSGIQFALPEAAENLMKYQQSKSFLTLDNQDNEDKYVLLNTCDPANLYGAASPFSLLHPVHLEWRLLRHPNNFIIFDDGTPAIAVEAKGSRLIPLRDLTDDQLYKGLSLLSKLMDNTGAWKGIRSIKVETWDQQPVRNTRIVPILKKLGYRDEFKVMILEKSV